jgi:hypothetical protein
MSSEDKNKKNGILQKILVKILPHDFALMQRSQSSCEIKRNAKGAVEFTVKGYSDTVESAMQECWKVFQDLDKKVHEGGGSSE